METAVSHFPVRPLHARGGEPHRRPCHQGEDEGRSPQERAGGEGSGKGQARTVLLGKDMNEQTRHITGEGKMNKLHFFVLATAFQPLIIFHPRMDIITCLSVSICLPLRYGIKERKINVLFYSSYTIEYLITQNVL